VKTVSPPAFDPVNDALHAAYESLGFMPLFALAVIGAAWLAMWAARSL
jgi:hypothetical protein